MRKAKLFLINITILTLTSLLMQSISISFNVYLSNKIGSQSVGLFTLIISVYAFFITLATSGINLASTKVASEQIAKNNNSGAQKVITQCLAISLCFGIASSCLLLLCSDFIVKYCFKYKITKFPLYVISIALPFISASSAVNGYFSATRKVSKTATCQITSQLITIVIAILLLKLLSPQNGDLTCICLIIATCFSEVISFLHLYTLYRLDKRKSKKIETTQNKNSYKKEIFRICIPVAITSYIRSGLNTLKQLLIPLRLEKSGLTQNMALSKYGIVSGMVMPILMLPGVFVNSFAGLVIPEFSGIFATKNYNRIKFLTNKIFKLSFAMSACIFGLFITFGDELLILIYHNQEASNYLLALAPLALIMYVDNIVDGMLRGLDEQVNVMKCNILDLFISTGFIYFFVPIFSIKAYIISIYISELLNGSISIYLLLRKTNIAFKPVQWLLKPVGIALISRYALLLIYSIFAISGLIPRIILYVISFLSLAIITSTLNIKDFKI